MFTLGNAIRSVSRRSEKGPLDILVISQGNEKYMSLVCQTENNFYLWSSGDRSWKNEIAEKPNNLQVITQDWPTSHADFILCNDRHEQYELAASLSLRFQIPIVLIDHCSSNVIKPLHAQAAEVPAGVPPEIVSRNPNVIVPVSEYISDSWPISKLRLCIPAAVDAEKFYIPPQRDNDAAFGINLSQRRVTFDNNIAPPVGEAIFSSLRDAPYTMIPTDSDIVEKERIYKQGDYFINTQNHVSVKMLEAMACGNIPICFSKPDLDQFIENGVNGLIVRHPGEIRPLLEQLDKLSPEERSQICNNARAKVLDSQITNENFISKWKSIFNYMRHQYYGISHNVGMRES